jgi:hypothetical protein
MSLIADEGAKMTISENVLKRSGHGFPASKTTYGDGAAACA